MEHEALDSILISPLNWIWNYVVKIFLEYLLLVGKYFYNINTFGISFFGHQIKF